MPGFATRADHTPMQMNATSDVGVRENPKGINPELGVWASASNPHWVASSRPGELNTAVELGAGDVTGNSPKLENHMLLIFLIGAALSHARPEPPPDDGLPTDPLRFHRERWRSRPGLSAFWR